MNLEMAGARRRPGFDGMWPQPSPWHEDLWPTLTNLDDDENAEHFRYNAARYLGQIATLTFPAAVEAARGPRVAPITDAQLAELLTETSYGQFIQLELDTASKTAFGPTIAERPESERHAVMDFTGVRPEPAEAIGAGSAPAPLAVLLSYDETSEGHEYRILAVALDGEVFHPEPGTTWELVKLFVLMAANYRLVLGTHGQLHFPHDIINVLTKMMMPKGHLIHRLLKPHGRFTLGLDSGVMNHARSVAHNDQVELFTPFAVGRPTIKALFAEARTGRAGNPNYAPYSYGQELIGEHSALGRYRTAWWGAYREFVSEVLSAVPADDAYVGPWADEISRYVPGFPNGAKMRDRETLVSSLALHLATVSVFHTTDHHSYSQIPRHWAPFRLRATPPSERRPTSLDMGSLVTREDYFRAYLAHRMFFKPVVIQPLSTISYPFRDAGALAAAERFAKARTALDTRWADSPFPASERIAVGIQY